MPYLLKLWFRPSAAMSEILDRGSLLFGSIAVMLLTGVIKTRAPWFVAGFFMPLLVLAVVGWLVWRSPVHFLWYTLIGAVAVFVVGLGISAAVPRAAPPPGAST